MITTQRNNVILITFKTIFPANEKLKSSNLASRYARPTINYPSTLSPDPQPTCFPQFPIENPVSHRITLDYVLP